MQPLVRAIYDDNSQLLTYLRTNQQLSFANSVENILPKVLLLATASHLEFELQKLILDYFREITNNRDHAVAFVEKKAVARQFHTYFSWDAGNANSFFALFGNDFKIAMAELCQTDGDFAAAVKNFVAVGSLRNKLVHQNYAAFTMENTADEIWRMYESALRFIDRLPLLLREHG
jgi:RiboL-PSP-HEPN